MHIRDLARCVIPLCVLLVGFGLFTGPALLANEDSDMDGVLDFSKGRTIGPGVMGHDACDCGTPDGIDSLPYPDRTAFDLKSIQPDFWPNHDEISGNLAGGVAFNLVWSEWESTLRSPPCGGGQVEYDGHCFPVSSQVDADIADYTARGLNVTGVVYGTPAWARISSCSPIQPGFEIFCAPVDASDYGRFVGMLADRYDGEHGHGRVVDFVIHNEVNHNAWFDIGCGQGLGPCDTDTWLDVYAANWNAAYDAVMAEQPTAKAYISLEHHFDTRWDQPWAEDPVLSGQTFLEGLAARAGGRIWRVAYHPYPPDLLSTDFSADDMRDHGKVTFGSVGALQGWLYQRFGDIEAARDVHLTESGVNSGSPQSSESAQATGVCESFRNILGTPGIEDHVYHRMQDHPAEYPLALGLWRSDATAKPAWATWALMNRPGQLDCGFEHVPRTRLARSYHLLRGHWASTRLPPDGFVEQDAWYLLRDAEPGTRLLFECAVGGHNLLSPDPGCEGQLALGPVGWIHEEDGPDREALYRCSGSNDHFISADPGCEGETTEQLLGYAVPAPVEEPPPICGGGAAPVLPVTLAMLGLAAAVRFKSCPLAD